MVTISATSALFDEGGNTTKVAIAGVLCAVVLIVAVKTRTGDAPASSTNIELSACISVVTLALIRDELAAYVRVAGIVGADISVVTRQFATRSTVAQVAVVAGGTDVAVIAKRIVQGGHTARLGVADGIGAWIIVGAIDNSTTNAQAILAEVEFVACIVVVALRPGKRSIRTAHLCIA